MQGTGLAASARADVLTIAPPVIDGADHPELRLRAALLEQAAADLAVYQGARDPIGARRWRDARRWIESAERRYPFSFVNVCEALGQSPAQVRARLQRAAAAAASTRGDDAAPRLRRA